MCLILFAYRLVPRRTLVLAANRDEYYDRPSLAAHWWDGAPGIYGGRDLRAGGTWLAVSRSGCLAAVTNWTDPDAPAVAEQSRGELPHAFLEAGASAQRFAEAIDGRKHAGFNFLAYDGEALVYASNRTGDIRVLPPGVYGLTNTRLGGTDGDTAAETWPKAALGVQALRRIAGDATLDDLLALLGQPLRPLCAVPSAAARTTAANSGPERRLSPAFIRGATYGTRASTAVIFEGGVVSFAERQYGPHGKPGRRTDETIALTTTHSPPLQQVARAQYKETA